MINIRKLEKSDKFGYFFWIKYNGKFFDAFDKIKNKKTIKEEFEISLKKLGISWAKGIQQGGRTDSGVSANKNLLYISTYFNGDLEKLKNDFNYLNKHLKIIKIEKTIPNLVIPDIIQMREYIYTYPKEKIDISEYEIIEKCKSLSGEYDLSEFTDFKGKKLKNPIRKVNIIYENNSLVFKGNSFLPKQIRIMSSYIFTNTKKIFPAKYLTLNNIILKKEYQNLIIKEIKELSINDVTKIEKLNDIYILYTNDKSALIGKRGKNIKKLRKKLGNVIIKGN
ncbi:tRNA pseudouridine(38-40) synthase [Hypnocyclicus thermotrophus]|uniref:tRNA pseudouridine(38-40) synthase n=1 Tax=Hypnocyclicus thermotrophus TaxID=1627895 RepID=A0AA46I529_9FUSO|nr:KH domain-containing protein [Hypnocyclicus thermotrophus]TDT68103.1 tRNA pseudouridine(38-40) synthase [Hypnocyclicus thermotrophus]